MVQASGKMINFEWRIGVAVSSSKCNNIYAPYVAISFDINEPNGQTTSHSAELTYEQFKVCLWYFNSMSNKLTVFVQEFSATFEKVSRVMDGL